VINYELLLLASTLAHCKPEDIMAAAHRPDGSMVVVVWPGPKFTYTAEEANQVSQIYNQMVMKIPPVGTDKHQDPAIVDAKPHKMVTARSPISADPDAKYPDPADLPLDTSRDVVINIPLVGTAHAGPAADPDAKPDLLQDTRRGVGTTHAGGRRNPATKSRKKAG